MEFIKMHGIGNDYVYVDCFKNPVPADPAALSVEVSKEHFGIGSDGLILIEPCEGADARMRIFNKDGSEGEMCGNGVRCVGKYLYDSGIAKKEYISVQTLGGLKILKMKVVGGIAVGARVDMGVPSTVPSVIPVNGDENPLFITEGGEKIKFFCVNCGNPHAVTHDLFPDEETFFRLGPLFEKSSAFPERANISFCKVVDETHLIARIWERGSGPTLACGTGATATFMASYLQGYCGKGAYVKLPGGELYIEYDEESGHLFMTGPAEITFIGNWLK